MDKLARLILSEVEKITAPCNGEYLPPNLDDIPDKELADWARKILRTIASDPKITFDPTGDRSNDLDLHAKMLSHLGTLLLEAPKAAENHVSTLRLGQEALLLGIRLIVSPDRKLGRSDPKHPKSDSNRWDDVLTWSTAAAALFEADGMSRRQACIKVADLLKKAGVTISADTIRKDWFSAVGDWALLEDTEGVFSMPRALIDYWIEEQLFDDRWLRQVLRGRPETEFGNYCVEMRHDLLTRFIPHTLNKACNGWKSEIGNLGENGV